MLTRCCICGLPLAVDGREEDSALCLDCLHANFGGQTVPDHWGRRVEAIPPVQTRRRREATCRVEARHREDRPHV